MTGKRFALIIANYQYEDKNLQKLEAPAYDARDLEEVLKKPDITGFEVTTLVNGSAETIRREIARLFAKKRRDDLLLLYFSGHGMLDVKGRLYLAIKDTNLDLLSGTAIEAAFITKEMNDSNSRRQLLILDCCNSGAFERGMRGPGASVHTCDVFEATGVGRFVMTATDSTQYAWEGDQMMGEAKNSVFTRYLIKGLKGEAANDEGLITFDSLYGFVHDHVVTETPKQRPCGWAYKQQGGKFVIARTKPTPTELPSDLEEKIKSHDSRVRLIGVQDLAELLHGRRISLALAAYYALERLSKDDSRMVSKAAEEELMGCPDDIRKIVHPPSPLPPDIIKLSANARELFDKGKYEGAIEKWEEVLKLDYENIEANEGIEEVKQILKKIDELNTSAQQLFDEGKYREAIDTWEKVLNLNPENQTAKDSIKKAEEEETKKQISELSSQAQKLLEGKRYAKAIAKWQEVLELDSENRKAIGGIEEAKWILKEIEGNKGKIDELNTSAKHLYNEGKNSEAIDKWNKVLNLNSENQTAKEGIKKAEEKLKVEEKISELSSQAQKLFEKKRYAEAIEKWQEVLELDSENRKAIEEIEKTEKFLKELKERRRRIDVLNTSAQQLDDEEKYREAIDKWNEVLNLDPENQTAKEGLKTAEEKLKEREKISDLRSQPQKLLEEKREERFKDLISSVASGIRFWEKRYEVEFDKEFDIIIHKKGVLKPPPVVIFDLVFGKRIGLKEVDKFKNKVEKIMPQLRDRKEIRGWYKKGKDYDVKVAYLAVDDTPGNKATDKIEQLKNESFPIDIFLVKDDISHGYIENIFRKAFRGT